MTTKSKQSTGSKFNRPHMIIPEEDTTWAVNQKPCVLRFWQQCWLADPYGSRWMKLVTNLSDSAFRLGRRVLEAASLFVFRRISIGSDGRTSVWEVKNLHGARVKDFWQIEKNKANTASNKADNISIQANTASEKASTRTQTQSEQAFHQVSGTAQEHLTISSKEIVRCISDTPTQNLHEEETAHAPLGGASPQSVQSVSEKEEELPAVTDCTTLALADAAPNQSALLEGEKQDCSVEARDCHKGICSAAPVAQNEKFLNSAIANQTQGQVEQSNSASLLAEKQDCSIEARDCHEGICSAASVTQNEKSLNSAIADQKIEPSCLSAELRTENSVSGVEIKADHEGQGSVAPVTSAEKWSHKAIVARSNVRPERMQKLQVAANSGQNPGFSFLQECWDDPALQIVIKKLLAKYPQWGIACVDGMLVKWEG